VNQEREARVGLDKDLDDERPIRMGGLDRLEEARVADARAEPGAREVGGRELYPARPLGSAARSGTYEAW
jgi:hypothetical protein